MEPLPNSTACAHEISLISVVWNARSTLEPFLDSIRAQSREPIEVILVDNGSTDGSREYLRTRDDVRLIESDENLGYGAGMNRGIREASGDAILLTNNDLRFDPTAFERMLNELERESRYGAVGPVVKVPPDPGEICPLLKGDPGLYYGWNFFSGFMDRWPQSRWVNWNLEFEPHHDLSDQAWVHGCCGLYRRE
ncbi:MAG: glycosyltransferase, partial [Planctomycetota bacterium]